MYISFLDYQYSDVVNIVSFKALLKGVSIKYVCMCVHYTVCEQTKLQCEIGELKIKLNVFTNKNQLKMISSPVMRSRSTLMFINIYRT